MMNTDYLDIYNKYKNIYQSLKFTAEELERDLIEYIGSYDRIDRITVRVKSPERFTDKALKIIDGKLKYENPFTDIQDIIGARIVTYYLEDVENITKLIKDYYAQIEDKIKQPDSHSEFSYFGRHFINFIPEGIRNDSKQLFFELQIKTLFQHAWSEAEHDLNYKSKQEINIQDKRLVAFSSAQAWGADQIFNNLFLKYTEDE